MNEDLLRNAQICIMYLCSSENENRCLLAFNTFNI
jgi:hypothetical protein